MNRGVPRIARNVAIGAGLVVYAVFAHVSISVPGNEALGAILAAGPLLLASVGLAGRTYYRVPALIACGLIIALVYFHWDELENHFTWLYLAEEAGTFGLLGASFGRTLAKGRVPMCTRFATLIEGSLSPTVVQYTRAVTLAWTLFFAAMTLALVIIFVMAPLPVWSVFAYFCTVPLVALMFVGEYLVRRRMLLNARLANISTILKAVSSGAPR